MVKSVNCYQCKYCTDILGDAHKRCMHPRVLDHLMSILAMQMVMRWGCYSDGTLKVNCDRMAINKGWCYYPLNFDPTWIMDCNGFSLKEKQENENKTQTIPVEIKD